MPSDHPVQNAIQALIRHLEERADHGDAGVWLTPKARKLLPTLPGIYQSRARGVAPEAKPAVAAAVAEKPPVTKPAAKVEAAPAPKPSPIPTAAPAVPPAPAIETPEILVPQGATKEAKLAWLREKARDWPPVKKLDSLRPTMVFAVGDPNAQIMFVGEAPGGEEERQQEPFVGPAGELLTKIIGAMGLARGAVYISNICKFRPALPNQGESNRKPSADEMAACMPFVMAEIDVIQPKVIVALGASAAEGLLGVTGSLASARNRFYSLKNIPTMITYHPSYLLRNQAMSERRKVWEDMMKVMDKVGLPISDKQRGYFLK